MAFAAGTYVGANTLKCHGHAKEIGQIEDALACSSDYALRQTARLKLMRFHVAFVIVLLDVRIIRYLPNLKFIVLVSWEKP
mmetsp:Transcript_29736/g.46423  ORF Transcript_29736/g.46423 Transcript_29736/m.46423 type:complete len:81 (+) Transcript_29736:555-797(+)